MNIQLNYGESETLESSGALEAGDKMNSDLKFNPRVVMMACASALQEINFKDEAAPLFNLLAEPQGYSTRYQVIVNGIVQAETEDAGIAHSDRCQRAKQGDQASLWVIFYPYQNTHSESFMSVRLVAAD